MYLILKKCFRLYFPKLAIAIFLIPHALLGPWYSSSRHGVFPVLLSPDHWGWYDFNLVLSLHLSNTHPWNSPAMLWGCLSTRSGHVKCGQESQVRSLRQWPASTARHASEWACRWFQPLALESFSLCPRHHGTQKLYSCCATSKLMSPRNLWAY